MKTLIAALMLLAPLTASARDPWTWQDTAWETGYLTLHVADWTTTRDAAAYRSQHPNSGLHLEANPVLGKRPGYREINAYFAATAIAHAGISYLIPSAGWRRAWQVVSLGIEVRSVGVNMQAGLSFRF